MASREVSTMIKQGSREVSTMIKQGFISDPSLSFSPSRTTSLSKPAIASPPPSPNDSTRSRHSNPTLLDMISDEHNRETRRYQDEPRREYHARVAKILTDFKNAVGPGDAKLTVVGREGYRDRVTMDVHKKATLQVKQLIFRLLQRDPKKRLGCFEGANDVNNHSFFKGINWALIRCTTPPELETPIFPAQLKTERKTSWILNWKISKQMFFEI
ncbi:unnamed protein product [Microthlaspi erraticum]|uniref:non-specific serine/threonine protein kinase n=1 Tax=Microthlaspi erraticum TaxID=1685480 RepID=A0A6D2JHC9_9BRAS|nr:unnamed protein product [Microthlaspi erraticum]